MSGGGVITNFLIPLHLRYSPALRARPGGTVAWDERVTEGQRGPPVDFFQPRDTSDFCSLGNDVYQEKLDSKDYQWEHFRDLVLRQQPATMSKLLQSQAWFLAEPV